MLGFDSEMFIPYSSGASQMITQKAVQTPQPHLSFLPHCVFQQTLSRCPMSDT